MCIRDSLYATSAIILIFYLLILLILKVDLSVYVYTLAVLLFLSPFYVILLNIINLPIEKLINLYYINDAKKILKKSPDMKIIGVTGSYGKTSTKYILGRMPVSYTHLQSKGGNAKNYFPAYHNAWRKRI